MKVLSGNITSKSKELDHGTTKCLEHKDSQAIATGINFIMTRELGHMILSPYLSHYRSYLLQELN